MRAISEIRGLRRNTSNRFLTKTLPKKIIFNFKTDLDIPVFLKKQKSIISIKVRYINKLVNKLKNMFWIMRNEDNIESENNT